MKQLDRLIFEQGGECFFCRKPLPKGEASIEHLVAAANGGPNHEDNCVACCKTFNAMLGSKPLKQKVQILLNQKGAFRCPAESPPADAVAAQKDPVVLPSSRPAPPASIGSKSKPSKPLFTLAPPASAKSSPASSIQVKFVTCPTCKQSVPAGVSQIDYRCQGCGGAFRY